MDTTKLKKFAQFARRTLMEQVGAKLESVSADGAAAQREHPEAFKKLETAIKELGEAQVIERVAYIWFNRFSALRFLDVNDLNPIRVVSPLLGQFQPEILVDAKAGNINDQLVPEATRRQVRDLLDGQTPSPDAQAEAYRLLLVAVCNSWQGAMPFLFERIDDYTELLLPADLLSNASVLAYLREAMTPDVCKDVEVIGWLYQFYISEKKDLVFASLKQNKKITAENIPAATQLFTPHWIVRYLVENSLGRLWLLNRPGSKLADKMEYYIAPEEPETDFLKIGKPEEIRVCDPACGSGHMLTYAFDLLYAIYEEEGYEADKIPALILANNLTGVEIDDRAGALAAFALAMKAAARLGRRRFLRMEVKPDICVMQDVRFKDDEIPTYISKVGRDLFTDGLIETMKQFDQAKNFGSLIVPKLKSVEEVRKRIAGADLQGNLFIRDVHERVQKVLEMAEALSARYHVVVANPPYAGTSGLNSAMQTFSKSNYPDSKSDLFAMFMERTLALLRAHGFMGMINMQAWMFLSSYEKLRGKLLDRFSLVSMAHLGARGFDTIGGEVVSTTAFVFLNARGAKRKGTFLRLTEGRSEGEKSRIAREAIERRSPDIMFLASAQDFLCIPGAPVAYWIGPKWSDAFRQSQPLGKVATASEGIKTGNNERFLRLWFEVQKAETGEASSGNPKWAYHLKGGEFRRWHGNSEYVILWKDNGRMIKGQPNSGIQGEAAFNRDAAIWSDITSGGYAARLKPKGHLFDSSSPAGFLSHSVDQEDLLGFLNSRIAGAVAPMLNPTLHFKVGNFRSLPYKPVGSSGARRLIDTSKLDVTSRVIVNALPEQLGLLALPVLERGDGSSGLQG